MPTPAASFESITHRVVVVGGGFGGLAAAMALKREAVRVTLVDRRNFHLFQPLLYQVATGGLSPANIAAPLRALLKRQSNADVLLGEVIGFDAQRQKVLLADGEVEYDSLIVAAGVRHHYFGNDEWERLAPGLKSVEDALEMRRRLLLAFEAAERETDETRRAAWLTFVIVGGGPTGVELAGAIAELSRHTLRRNFRRINPASARILLVEGADRLLPPYAADLSAKAKQQLERLGVEVRTGVRVSQIEPDSVMLLGGDEAELIETRTVLWGAGVKASPLGRKLAEATGVETDRGGRVVVEHDCSLPGYENIFVIGDLANFQHGDDEQPLPGVAPVAIQQGKYVARRIVHRLLGRETHPFRYRDLGGMAVIGRASAVADLLGLHLSGVPAWLAWLFVHLMSLVGFENRILVLLQWSWNYFTRNRAARLITGDDTLPHVGAAAEQQAAESTTSTP
ncbi:MAG: NAD(P)/FAD-dependent oxidoreductase [Pirellulaceae bacterium]